MRKKIIIGNWKMNNFLADTESFFSKVEKELIPNNSLEFGVAVPFIYLASARKQASNLIVAAQNCHFESKGAFTGEISVDMLKDINIKTVIIGHSERREYFNETNAAINKKIIKCLDNNFVPVFCVGETLSQYEAGKTNEIVKTQLIEGLKGCQKNLETIVIAYEPIWAIGTGKTATPEQAETVCAFIRETIGNIFSKEIAEKIRIQYGGSVKPDNIKMILSKPNIDGALVGGASVQAESFIDLIRNWEK